ncbi:MAG: hypothetical protein VKJ44_05760, partial [Synechococcus sp.]|nr:hypothetical protein [Synechococcus sp.]
RKTRPAGTRIPPGIVQESRNPSAGGTSQRQVIQGIHISLRSLVNLSPLQQAVFRLNGAP